MTDHFSSAEAVIEAYAVGTRTCDVALLKEIFDDNAVMVGWLGPDFLNGGPEPFFGAREANDVGDDYTSETLHVTVAGKVATAETRETNLLGLSFNNYFQLAQRPDGTWRLISKLFRHD